MLVLKVMQRHCYLMGLLIPFSLLVVTIGCVSGLPSTFSLPPDTPWEVRKQICRFHLDAQWRAQACLDLAKLDIKGVDCTAAIPWLIVLLKDDTYAWSPSIFYRYTGTPVWHEAAMVLRCIGAPSLDALISASKTNPNKRIRRRTSSVAIQIRLHEADTLEERRTIINWIKNNWPELAWRSYKHKGTDELVLTDRDGYIVLDKYSENIKAIKSVLARDRAGTIFRQELNTFEEDMRRLAKYAAEMAGFRLKGDEGSENWWLHFKPNEKVNYAEVTIGFFFCPHDYYGCTSSGKERSGRTWWIRLETKNIRGRFEEEVIAAFDRFVKRLEKLDGPDRFLKIDARPLTSK